MNKVGNVERLQVPVAVYSLTITGKSDNTNPKRLDSEIAENKQADIDAIRTLVNIIPRALSKPIASCATKIRNHFEKHGIRFGKTVYGIPFAILPKFKSELDRLTQEYYLHVSKLTEYAESGELRSLVLKSAGVIADQIEHKIPTPEAIAKSYDVEVRVSIDFEDTKIQQAMAIIGDELKNQLREEVTESIKKENENSLNSLNGKIVGAVKELIKDIQNRCKVAEKGTQWKTMIDKIQNIVNVLPSYNVLQNPELDKLIEDVKTKFGGISSNMLKDSESVRKEVIEKSKEIENTFINLF